MNPETLAVYRARLERQRAALKSTHQDHATAERESHQAPGISGSDHAAEWEEIAVETRIAESEELLLAKIEHALGRIARGTYGFCEGCGAAIPETRLDARPSVSLCVTCQEAKEAGG